MDHAGRRDRLRHTLALAGGAQALLVTDLPNIRYLTGFSGSNAVFLLGDEAGGDLLGTDGRYVTQAEKECPDLPVVIDRATLPAVLAHVGSRALAVESTLDVAQFDVIRSMVGEPHVLHGPVEDMRLVKDADEIAVLEAASRITVQALEHLIASIEVGVPEVVLARRLEGIFADLGAEDRAFPTIVASGPHAAIPHHRPTPAPLGAGHLLVIDAGAMVEGYHADMTRTFIVGDDPDGWQRELHAAVLAAQSAAIASCVVGADLAAIDASARIELRERDLEEQFTHGLGHGVGLVIHEAPALGERATGRLLRNIAFTVEPGAYLPGRGGVRIEDTLVATDVGPRVLTESPRDLRVVGV